MEKIGYRVGFSLVEKATKEEARFKENVEIVKYICKVNNGRNIKLDIPFVVI